MNTAGKRTSHPICPGLAHSQKKGTPMMLSKPDQTPPRLERTTLEKKYKERHDLEFPSKHRYIESNRIRKRVLWVVCVLFAAFFLFNHRYCFPEVPKQWLLCLSLTELRICVKTWLSYFSSLCCGQRIAPSLRVARLLLCIYMPYDVVR